MLKRQYPGVPVVSYVNTSCRGEGRVRCVLHVGQRRGGRRIARPRDRVIFLPDAYLGRYVADPDRTPTIVLWHGHL